jgi:hypothetical protein
VRWSHNKIVECLIEEVKWNKKEMNLAYRHVAGENDGNLIKSMIKEYGR